MFAWINDKTKRKVDKNKTNQNMHDSESVGLVGRRLTCDQLSYFPFAWETSPFSEKKKTPDRRLVIQKSAGQCSAGGLRSMRKA